MHVPFPRRSISDTEKMTSRIPSTFIALLSTSEQADQAVVTSTVMLWRSLGTVIGVASSSLVIQNALALSLDKLVSGPEKERVVREIRKSIKAISGLPPEYRAQVVDAYAISFRVTFMATAVLALISVLLVVNVKLPRLGKRL
jgi:hypothetical protein